MAIHDYANRRRNGHDDSELFWLAFRYCIGEMSPDEALDFEERLDFDQEAREAVAEAVELGAATELAETQLPEPYFILPWFLRPASLLAALERADVRERTTKVGGIALAAAACMALVIAGFSRFGRETPATPSPEDRQLANVWATSGEFDPAADERDPALDPGAMVGFELLSDELAMAMLDEGGAEANASGRASSAASSSNAGNGVADEGELLISDWLLEAVFADQEDPAAEPTQIED